LSANERINLRKRRRIVLANTGDCGLNGGSIA
jgi:hypothetical protein